MGKFLLKYKGNGFCILYANELDINSGHDS